MVYKVESCINNGKKNILQKASGLNKKNFDYPQEKRVYKTTIH